MKYLPENKEFLAVLIIFLIIIAFCCCIKSHCGPSRKFNYSSQSKQIANELEVSDNEEDLPS